MPGDPRLDAAALRTARVRAGLTQHELARLVGVAGGERVSRWELGTSSPRPEILVRIAATLDVSLADLFVPGAEPADLRGLRVATGLSMEELATRVHVSKATLSRWESGHLVNVPSRAALQLLADSLAATVEDVERAFDRSRDRRSA